MLDTYWTESMLSAWRAEMPADFPDWRRDLYEDMRRMNWPTYAEGRAAIRNDVRRYMTGVLRQARSMPPEWLKPKGHAYIRDSIKRKRAKHSDLIRREREECAKPTTELLVVHFG